MFTLYKKELNAFLSSLIGYITIIVFLLINGLLLWVFNTDFNILDFGYAGIDGLFVFGPFVFLFLIPAITMRMFAEEKKNGTMELLLTKPLNDYKIITAKFLAAFSLVIFSLIPTIIYYISVYNLGMPKGNIDAGGTLGSYIGLFFLGAAFCSIGLFSSSITNNQIVSFIVSVTLCAFLYLGFDTIYTLSLFGPVDLLIKSLGISHHYSSISRGVVDTRDVLYFLSLVALFIVSTYVVLQSRKWQK